MLMQCSLISALADVLLNQAGAIRRGNIPKGRQLHHY